jgi:hypothetical protein
MGEEAENKITYVSHAQQSKVVQKAAQKKIHGK